jgi:hypothetical protein
MTKPMLDVFAEFATDEVLEVEGTWVPYGVAQFKVARTGTRKYAKLISDMVEENRLLLDKNDAEAEKLDIQIGIDAIAQAILVDWKDVSYLGKPMSYSVENAKTLLKHRDFRMLVLAWAADITKFKAKRMDDVVKN